MTDDSKYNNGFSADDIERYHSGKMSSLEMHQLEKAAMEDPFLADALEGYAFTQTPAEDRAWLQSQLQAKTEGAKVVLLKKSNRSQFLRIAALVILLIGCGWAIYQFGFNTKKNDLAVAKSPEGKNVPPLKQDTTPNESELKQSAPTNTNVSTPPESDDTNLNTQKTAVENKGNGIVTLSTQNRHTGRINAGASEEQDQTKRGMKLSQNQTGGLESATIATSNDAVFQKADSPKEKEIDSNNRGFVASSPQTVTPGKENVIVLQRNKNAEPIPEVVLGKSMKDSTYRKPLITFEEAVPEKGSKYFDDYVAQNLQLPEEELKKNISGEVKLSFDVNESGQAVNIAVVKSLCSECDKEAIRVLQQGPKWVKKRNAGKGIVSIKF